VKFIFRIFTSSKNSSSSNPNKSLFKMTEKLFYYSHSLSIFASFFWTNNSAAFFKKPISRISSFVRVFFRESR
jgi:hypothetical protein